VLDPRIARASHRPAQATLPRAWSAEDTGEPPPHLVDLCEYCSALLGQWRACV